MLPITLFAVGIVRKLSVEEREATERRTLIAARTLAEAVERETFSSIRTLQALAKSEELDQRDYESFYLEVRRVLSTQPWLTVTLVTPDGQPILNAKRPYGIELPPPNEPESLQRTIQTREPTVGNLAAGYIGNRMAFPIRVPILREGEVQYVLTAIMTPQALTDAVEKQTPIEDEWTRTVVDGEGIVVARTRDPQRFVGRRGTPPFLQKIAASSEGVYQDITLEGQQVYVAFHRITGSQWTAAVTVPVMVVEDPAQQAMGLVITAGLVSLLLSLAGAIALSEGISRSISRVTKGAKTLAQGGKPEVGFSSIQEVALLGNALETAANLLAEQERERMEHLDRVEAARAEAEAANRLKDEFLITISHELKTPLNAILGWSTLLQTGRLDAEKTEQAIATIERNARVQARLVDDLLDTSRIITGKLRLETEPVDLAAVITNALDSIRHGAEAKAIQLHTQLMPDMEPVLGDQNRLQQVVWNLLSNAVKFTPSGGNVTAKLKKVDNWAEITICDTGRGIKPEFLPYVFDRFRQADSSTTREFGGLGLGLAIVRHLVELHGGTVWADSKGLDQGAAFTLRLPLNRAPLKASPSSIPSHTESSIPSAALLVESDKLKGARILVVDDEPDARDMTAAVLTPQGATVRVCESAAEGFAAVTTWNPTVILSDIGMPQEDGYSFMARVRVWESAQGGRIPAIALTAFAREEDRNRAIAAGYDRHLAKPIDPVELVTLVAHLVSP